MEIVDLTQNFHTQRIVSQAIETALHVGTHIDAEMHGSDGGADIASVPLDRLVHEGVGGDLENVANERLLIGPWKLVGGEASICRILAFRGTDLDVSVA